MKINWKTLAWMAPCATFALGFAILYDPFSNHQVTPPIKEPSQSAVLATGATSTMVCQTIGNTTACGTNAFWSAGGGGGLSVAPLSDAERYVFAGLLPFEVSRDKALRLEVRRWAMSLPDGKPRAAYIAALDEYDRNDAMLDGEHLAQQAAEDVAKEAPRPDCKHVGDDFVCATKNRAH